MRPVKYHLPPQPEFHSTCEFERVYSELRETDNVAASTSSDRGLEQFLADALIIDKRFRESIRIEGHSVKDPQDMFFEPSSRILPDTALRDRWQSICLMPTSLATLAYLAGLLSPQHASPRIRSPSVSLSAGKRVLYPAVTTRSHDLISDYVTRQTSPLARAVTAYGIASIGHFLDDANGRAARALVLVELGRCGVLTKPWLPLTVVLYANTDIVLAALDELGLRGDWGPIARTLIEALIMGARLASAGLLLLARASDRRTG